MALRLARTLLADAPRWSAHPDASAERASLLSRTGKWIAQSRCAPLFVSNRVGFRLRSRFHVSRSALLLSRAGKWTAQSGCPLSMRVKHIMQCLAAVVHRVDRTGQVRTTVSVGHLHIAQSSLQLLNLLPVQQLCS